MRAKQPGRVVIMTAVQTVTDDTMHVSSYEALMRYSSILSKQALSALSAAPVMLSFEVSPWTANDRDDTDDTMGMEYGGYSWRSMLLRSPEERLGHSRLLWRHMSLLCLCADAAPWHAAPWHGSQHSGAATTRPSARPNFT